MDWALKLHVQVAGAVLAGGNQNQALNGKGPEY